MHFTLYVGIYRVHILLEVRESEVSRETSRHFYSANHEAQSIGPAAYCVLGETIGKTDKNWLSIDHIELSVYS